MDTEDNVSTSSTTPFVGPIEGKVLRGSDGRDYLLEMMRLTPRDANYVRGPKGTGKVATLEGEWSAVLFLSALICCDLHRNRQFCITFVTVIFIFLS